MGLPDELGLHRVVEGHEHLCILADLAHHILQSHKEGERRCGGKLRLSAQINILPLRLLGEKQTNGRLHQGALAATNTQLRALARIQRVDRDVTYYTPRNYPHIRGHFLKRHLFWTPHPYTYAYAEKQRRL